MVILVINWQDWQNKYAGGAEVYFYEIFSRLLKRGHSVILLCSRGEGQRRYEVIDGFEIFRIGRRFNFNFYVPFALRAILRKKPVDVIIDDLNKIPFYSPLFTRKKNLAMVMHLFRRTIFKETNIFFAGYVFITERIIPLLYHNSNFIAISESSAEDLKKMGVRKKIYIVYSGIPEIKDNSIIQRKKNLIAYVGRIKRYKSIDHLLKAIATIREEMPVELVVAGDGDARDELVEFSRKLNIKVDFCGMVSEQKKYEIYKSARVVVQPSIKEGWGLTVIEAQSCGTPVVCANSPGLRETLIDGKTGFLYEYGNIAQLAERIKILISDDSLWHKFSDGAKEWAKNFSWEHSAGLMEKILREETGKIESG